MLSSLSSIKHLATRLQSAQQCLIEPTQKRHDHLSSIRHDVVHPGFWWVGPIYCLWHSFPTGSPLLATHPRFDDLYAFRKLMLSRPKMHRLRSFFLYFRRILDWNVVTTPMTHEFALAHEQLSWFHQRLPPMEALSFCTIPYDFARVLHGVYGTNHALCTTGAVSPYYGFHCPLPGDPFSTTCLPAHSSFACMQDSWITRETMSAITNMLLSSKPPRVILIVFFLARDCWTQTQHLCHTGLGTQIAWCEAFSLCAHPTVTCGTHRPSDNRPASLSFRTSILPLRPKATLPPYTYFYPSICDKNFGRVA